MKVILENALALSQEMLDEAMRICPAERVERMQKHREYYGTEIPSLRRRLDALYERSLPKRWLILSFEINEVLMRIYAILARETSESPMFAAYTSIQSALHHGFIDLVNGE